MQQPWVIAHRGASGHAPENTMAAFRRAVEMGASFIETDLRMSRDAHFVAIHDLTVGRTTNGHGRVPDLLLSEMRQLDAGSWFAKQFERERIPTLDEILVFAAEKDVVFYLEVKPEAALGLSVALVGELRRSGQLARVVILSFEPATIDAFRRLDPTLMTGLLLEETSRDPIETALRVGARQLGPRRDLVTRDLVERAHRADLQVVTWTVNDPEEMRALAPTGVNGIMTNYPDRLFAVLRDGGAQTT